MKAMFANLTRSDFGGRPDKTTRAAGACRCTRCSMRFRSRSTRATSRGACGGAWTCARMRGSLRRISSNSACTCTRLRRAWSCPGAAGACRCTRCSMRFRSRSTRATSRGAHNRARVAVVVSRPESHRHARTHAPAAPGQDHARRRRVQVHALFDEIQVAIHTGDLARVDAPHAPRVPRTRSPATSIDDIPKLAPPKRCSPWRSGQSPPASLRPSLTVSIRRR